MMFFKQGFHICPIDKSGKIIAQYRKTGIIILINIQLGAWETMDYKTLLNQHLEQLNISTKEISDYTGLSPSVISRYRHGERTPLIHSPQYVAIIDCLVHYGLERAALQELYESVLLKDEITYQNFLKKFQILLEYPTLSIKDLANTLSYDVSYLYKIKNGQRQPQHLEDFIESVSAYTTTLCTDSDQIHALNSFLGINISPDADTQDIQKSIEQFFYPLEENAVPDASSFLSKLDDFNLDSFIDAIHFNDLKIPTLPFSITPSKTYYGVKKMREAELDFFKSTALSTSKSNIFMHSDMPIVEMADDMDFNKKWMFGIAAAIKKGLTIEIIHHLDRPVEELMLGLEAWIPIYMTGQVMPFYLPSTGNEAENIFHHLTYVSGSCALSGQCIEGYHNDGRYELSTKHTDIHFFRKKANQLLSKALPLMDIYTEFQLDKFYSFTETLKEQSYVSIGENTFKNLTIKAYDDFVIVSKQIAPRIEFVIRHPILVDAIKNFKEARRD